MFKCLFTAGLLASFMSGCGTNSSSKLDSNNNSIEKILENSYLKGDLNCQSADNAYHVSIHFPIGQDRLGMFTNITADDNHDGVVDRIAQSHGSYEIQDQRHWFRWGFERQYALEIFQRSSIAHSKLTLIQSVRSNGSSYAETISVAAKLTLTSITGQQVTTALTCKQSS